MKSFWSRFASYSTGYKLWMGGISYGKMIVYMDSHMRGLKEMDWDGLRDVAC